MAALQKKSAANVETLEPSRKQRTDPRRLKAFAQRLNVMLGEVGLPERGRAKLIKDRVGVSGTTAANWLRGESYPSFEELGRIGRLGVDPIRLFSDADESAHADATLPLTGLRASKRLAQLVESNQLQPLAQTQIGNAGRGHAALASGIWQQILARDLTGFALIYMKGDAMQPRLMDGTPLIVDTNNAQINEDNAIYALLLGDAVIVRRVQRRLQGGYLIACDNPAMPNETIERLSAHGDESRKASNVLVLGRISLAIQKL